MENENIFIINVVKSTMCKVLRITFRTDVYLRLP
jgi:hypothetical protein